MTGRLPTFPGLSGPADHPMYDSAWMAATVVYWVATESLLVFGAPDALDPAEQARRCVALAREIQTV